MESKWKEMAFGDCAELVRETCQPEEAFGKPYIGLEHIEQGTLRLSGTGIAEDVTSTKSKFKAKDILFGKLRPYFRKIIQPKFDGICSTDIWVVRSRNGIDQRFVFYWMVSKEFVDIANQGSEGTKMPRAKWDFVAKIKQKLPPLPEQKAIALILGALDDKIEMNRKINETLEAMARAIFKSWFVDFDPIPGLGPHKEWQDSPFGKIPKGWKVAQVSEAFEINPLRQIKKGIQYTHVDMKSLPTTSARVIKITRREFTGSGSKFKNGDVLFARITPCLENGKAALVDFLPENEYGWGSTEFIVFHPKEPLNPWFVYCVARNQEFRDHAIRAMSGTSGRQRVEIGCFNNFSIGLPPAEIAAKFADIVKPWFSQMKINDEQANTLVAIRETLLPKLLSGEIRVERCGEVCVRKILKQIK